MVLTVKIATTTPGILVAVAALLALAAVIYVLASAAIRSANERDDRRSAGGNRR